MAKLDEEQLRELRGEHLRSYNQSAPIGALSKIPDIQRGLKQWGPDLAGWVTLADPADMLAYAARKVARGQSEKSVPSLGLGEKVRGALAKTTKPRQTEVTEWKEPSATEEAVRFLNPTLWGNPFKIMQGPLGKVAMALHGDTSGLLGVIKPKGGNWHPDFGPQAALEGYNRTRGISLEDMLKLDPERGEHNWNLANTLDKWVQGPLAKYMMRDMATENDPIRKLAEQGILHVKPEELNFNMSTYGKWPLEGQTFHAQSDAAKAWEGASDNAIGESPRWMLAPEEDSSPFAREHPWSLKLPEDTPIYSMTNLGRSAEDLGFNQLIDHVYTGLMDGRITPEQLKSGSFGVEAAVRDADKIRKAKEAQDEAELLKRSRNASVVTHKEYPDNNPEGYHWVEIKPQDGDAWEAANSHLSPQEYDQKVAQFRIDRKNSLQQALNHEGEVMGHCVGDYCDKVLDGDQRIFSLRDAKGKSHVTVETAKNPKTLSEAQVAFWEDRGRLPRDIQELDDWGVANDIPIDGEADWETSNPLWRVNQIKGSGKKDSVQRIIPEDLPKFQPYIQDFLNSQSWSDVRDLHNAALRDMGDLYGVNLPTGEKRFMTPAEQQDFNRRFPDIKSRISEDLDNGDWEVEMAEGGRVAPDIFDNLELFLRG